MLAKILPINDFILWLEGWLSTILQKRGKAGEDTMREHCSSTVE